MNITPHQIYAIGISLAIVINSIGFWLVEEIKYTAPEPQYEEVEAEVTAYNATEAQTDDRPWETASGVTVNGFTAACPSYLDFGTIIEIDGKEYVCEDRMNKRYRDGEYYDIIKPTKRQALAWGRQTVTIKIYE